MTWCSHEWTVRDDMLRWHLHVEKRDTVEDDEGKKKELLFIPWFLSACLCVSTSSSLSVYRWVLSSHYIMLAGREDSAESGIQRNGSHLPRSYQRVGQNVCRSQPRVSLLSCLSCFVNFSFWCVCFRFYGFYLYYCVAVMLFVECMSWEMPAEINPSSWRWAGYARRVSGSTLPCLLTSCKYRKCGMHCSRVSVCCLLTIVSWWGSC